MTALIAFGALGSETLKRPAPFPLNLFEQAKAEDYIDEAACARCHKQAHANLEPSPHRTFVADPSAPKDKQGCQSCHGPGGPHVEHRLDPEERYNYVISYSRVTPAQASMACMRCHDDTMTLAHFKRTGHGKANVSCIACHGIHQDPHGRPPQGDQLLPGPGKKTASGRQKGDTFTRSSVFFNAPPPRKLLKADEPTLCGECHKPELNEFRHNFHHPVPEGRLVCSDCHEVHPRRAAEKQTAAHTRLRPAKEMCVTCHAETAGPFVFEHDPVVGLTGEGCMECHRAHGSQNPKMLSTFSRGVCSQCHTDKANNHFPGRSCWQAGCHVAMHGSNSDPLFLRR
jgi:predicted CXXCH cytochrome family protein